MEEKDTGRKEGGGEEREIGRNEGEVRKVCVCVWKKWREDVRKEVLVRKER